MNHQQHTGVLERIAEEDVSEDIDLWPGLQVRVRALASAAPRRKPAFEWIGKRGWFSLAATAAVVLVLAIGLVPGWSGTEAVSAETILDRATTVASGAASVSSYHLLMTRQDMIKGGETAHSEVWFAGPDRQRTIERVTDAGGSQVLLQDVIFNGSETWIVKTENGQTQAIHTLGTTWTRPAAVPSAQGNLADLLSQYAGKQCSAARLLKDNGSVAGRQTYVIVVAERPAGGCAPAPAAAAASPSPVAAGGNPAAHVSGQVTQSRLADFSQPVVWVSVDRQSFLPLETEVRDAAGKVLQRSEVTLVDYNVSIPDAIFAYTPPAGVTVSTFTGGDGSAVKRALNPQPDQPSQPTKPTGH